MTQAPSDPPQRTASHPGAEVCGNPTAADYPRGSAPAKRRRRFLQVEVETWRTIRACLPGASAPALRACWRKACRSAPVAACNHLRPGRRRATHVPSLLRFPASGRGFPEAVAELGGVRPLRTPPVK
jgi:hypothetical protein